MTIVMPSFSFNVMMSSSSSYAVTGSRPAEGSSKNTSSGSSAIARAMAARFFMPPDSSEGILSSVPWRPTMRSFASTMARTASSGSSVQVSRGRAMFSPTVIEPSSAPDWNITPKAGRPTSLDSGIEPSTLTMPESGVSRPIRYRSMVDFPDPLPPRITKISPRST